MFYTIAKALLLIVGISLIIVSLMFYLMAWEGSLLIAGIGVMLIAGGVILHWSKK